jgi:hypothetical protein
MDKHENGLTARAALERFPGGISYYDGRLGREVCGQAESLIDRLRDGSWRATGFLAPVSPQPRRENVPARCWEFLRLDIRTDTAAGGGLEYVGLRFHESEPAPRLTAPAEERCREWLVETMQAPKTKTRDQLLAGAGIEGLSDKAFLRAWADATKLPTTHPSWRKPGPVRSS